LNRWTRLLAALLGVAFHQFARATMQIDFSSLWGCYVVRVDWSALAAWLRRLVHPGVTFAETSRQDGFWPALSSGVWRARLLVGLHAVLVLSCVVQGARGQVRSYPFACYPTFQWLAARRMPDLRIALLVGDEERVLRDGPASQGRRSQAQWGMVWRAMGLYDGDLDERRLLAYLQTARDERSSQDGELLRKAHAARFYRVDVDVAPGHWSDPAPTRLLAELPLR
jgi:hypothetical protein